MRWTVSLMLFFSFLAIQAKPVPSTECIACHDDKGPEKFRAKSHRDLACVKCHAAISSLPHEEKIPEVQCKVCHSHEVEDYQSSVHGLALLKGVQHVATCRSCHGPAHEIVSPRHPESKVARQHMKATCGTCHPADFLERISARLAHRSSRMAITPDQLKDK